MPDFRVFYPPSSASIHPADSELELSAPESHHLVTVNRARIGDPVIAFDGAGHEWETILARADRRSATLTVVKSLPAAQRRIKVTLAQSLPKGGTMENIVRQATELGVSQIVPLITSRSQIQLEGARAQRKIEKWGITALEAAKQCGNPWLPDITPIHDWEGFLPRLADFDLCLVASLQANATSLRTVLAESRNADTFSPHTVLWLVGPEGDFSPGEMHAAIRAGCRPVSLGEQVLRCDTAAVCALSILSYEIGPPNSQPVP